VVRPAAALLALHVLHYPEEVRAGPTRERPANGRAVTAEELQLASALIDAASGPAEWESYRDERSEELRALLEAKIAGRQAGEAEPTSAALPLLDALKQSVAAAQANSPDAPSRMAKSMRKRGRRTA
jgi:DNA end-binding protein Ku